MNRRSFIKYGVSAAATGAVGAGAYTYFIEPHWLDVVERDLQVDRLPSALAGARLLHLSDIHVGPRVSDEYLTRSFARARALAADIVVITGDLISYTGAPQLTQLRAVLRHLPRGPLGTFASLGNHDYGHGWRMPDVADNVARELADAGVTVLRNDVRAVGGLAIVGLDDLWAHRFSPERVLAEVRGAPAIVLSHNPDTLDRPGWGDYRGWILAGHTHGGQCKPPFLPPPLLPVVNKRYTSGEIALGDGRRLYINRGLGHLIKVRFNVRPELTLFTLR